jgi:hypothetical protein
MRPISLANTILVACQALATYLTISAASGATTITGPPTAAYSSLTHRSASASCVPMMV